MQKQVQDYEFLSSLFIYNKDEGSLKWKERNDVPKWWNTRYAGTSPTATDSLGYIRAKITRNGWSGYVSVHRICFFLHHGWLPTVVDHVDGNVKNNRAKNLRDSDWRTNTWNRAANKETETGLKGVKVIRKKGKINGYTAFIGHDGIREYLGFFHSAELAGQAYRKREKELRDGWSDATRGDHG